MLPVVHPAVPDLCRRIEQRFLQAPGELVLKCEPGIGGGGGLLRGLAQRQQLMRPKVRGVGDFRGQCQAKSGR